MGWNHLSIPNVELEQFKFLLEDWIPKESSIVIATNNMYVYFSPSIRQIQLTIGETVSPNSIAATVLATNQKTDVLLDESIFGYPYYGVGYPIYIGGQQAALIVILPEKKEPYKFLTGKQNDDWMPIPIGEISHIESLQKKTWFYAEEEHYRTNITLKELETKLPDSFIRIHRSYILNIYYIHKITRDVASNLIIKLKNGAELPVSQSYANKLRNLLEF